MKQIGKLKILSDFRPADRLSELEEVPKIGNRIDYWQAAKMLCEKDGGHLATREELAQIASEIYVNNDGSPVKIKKDDNTCDLRIKSRHKSNPPLAFGLSSYWSSDEYDASKAYYWYFGISTTGGSDYYWDYKNYSYYRAICIVNIQDKLDLVNELEQECERSRKRISDLEERIINHSNEVEEYCSRMADKNRKCEKYEQALEEIKEIAEQFCNACQEFEPEKKSSNCMYCNYGKILDIINKAKGKK